jgi:dihydroflavonol-4-reductase
MTATTSLVTGGAGFIGRHLVQQLVERGQRVRVLDIAPSDDFDDQVDVITGSILEPETVHRALEGVDHLYHLAANPYLWAPRKAAFEETNLLGTRIVLGEAERAKLKRVVHTSTESVLKSYRHRHNGPISEDTQHLSVDDMPGAYCRSKFLAEVEARKAAERGLPIVIVNPTLPVGPGDRNLTPPTHMILQFLRGGIPAFFNCQLNMIDVRDAALGHILACEKGRPGERYVLGGESLDLSQLLASLQDITGRPMPKVRVPCWLALATGVISEFVSDHISHKPPVAPLTGVRLACLPTTLDSTKAMKELGLPCTPIRAALTEAVAWLEEEGYLEGDSQRFALASTT